MFLNSLAVSTQCPSSINGCNCSQSSHFDIIYIFVCTHIWTQAWVDADSNFQLQPKTISGSRCVLKKDNISYLQCNVSVILVTLRLEQTAGGKESDNANLAIKNQLAWNQMLCLQCNSNINAFPLQNQDNT